MSKEKRYLQWGYDSFKDTKTGEISDNYILLLNQQDQQIAELEEQLKNAIVPKFKIGQEVFYLKHLVVVKGKIQDILTINNGFHYNFVWDDYEWIKDDMVFATKEEAEQRLKEIKDE